MIKDKRILITGGAGSVGSELTRQLVADNQVFVLDLDESAFFDLYEELRLEGMPIRGQVGDICNQYTVDHVFAIFRPEIVFHAAALKHVTPTEHNPRRAIEVNELGTCNLVEMAHKYNIEKFIFISSDKAVNNEKIYGNTKRNGELITKNAGYVSVRFGNVLGSQGSVIPLWQRQLDQNKPLTVTDERMQRYFMSMQEVCYLLIQAAEIGEPGSLIILDMGEKKNILQVAQEILGKLGKTEYPIKIIGARPGETLIEELMTPAEKARAIQKDKFWIIK